MKSVAEFQQLIKEADKLQIGGVGSESSATIDMSAYTGVVEYYPEELVISLKAGSSMAEAKEILAENNQDFSFYSSDPDQSIGALYATSGAELADSVLGVQIINGKGELMNFGGQVMKNVAGYDVSRLLVGSRGQLALITQISYKILPKDAARRFQIKPKTKQSISLLHKTITGKLKQLFDPYGGFV